MMKFFSKEEKSICPVCKIEELPDDPAKVVMRDMEYCMCKKCEKLMETIYEKIRSRLDDESL